MNLTVTKCNYCSKEIFIYPCQIGKKKFCSRYCLGKGTKKRKSSTKVKCFRCEKEVIVSNYRIKNLKKGKFYCSVSCKNKGIEVKCPICKKQLRFSESTFKVRKSGIKCCSRECMIKASKLRIINFGFKNQGKGGKNNEYKRIYVNGKQMKEHRVIMEKFLGRKLQKHECVHHINENKKDNSIENLMIVSNSEHGKIHKKTKS